MISINNFLQDFTQHFALYLSQSPWEISKNLSLIIQEKIQNLDNQYIIENGIAIHQTAVIESNVILKAPIIISENCFIGANAYLRGGVFLGKSAKIGTACEIKTSLIFSESAIAHFNFIGDSLIGSQVNFEAGSITANHFNERTDKQIVIHYQGQKIPTQSEKFGALVGDYSKIGANAVLSPGTILEPYSIVKRLELVEQNK